jgi:hypothetical protein
VVYIPWFSSFFSCQDPCKLDVDAVSVFSQINSESSPYESEDDFFTRSQDDSYLAAKRSPSSQLDINGRPRGQSESMVNVRPASTADGVKI